MDGIILINKQKGYTSHDVVAIVKRIFNEKVGHTGTLDPIATGVLPLLIGKGTKLSKYLVEHDKIYMSTLKLGIKTDTADITGNVICEKEVNNNISEENIKNALDSLKGEQYQTPPMYSAIKVNGKKLYEYARSGKTIQIKPRKIEIYNIYLNNFDKENNEIIFTVECSKGTYIRTLCEKIAESLNEIGCMKELQRIQVGKFNIKDAITIEDLKQNKDNKEFLNEHIETIENVLEDKQYITIENKNMEQFLNGVKLKKDLPNGIYKIRNEENIFIGTGEIKDSFLKRDIITI